jgi:rare lipoprotein A
MTIPHRRAFAAAVLWAAFLLTPAVAGPACHGIAGTASFYGTESCQKHRPCRTATGAYFDGSSMTMAVPSRAMIGKRFRVTNMATGQSVDLTADDYGPAKWTGRVADLSRAAAVRLGMIRAGTARICMTVLP